MLEVAWSIICFLAGMLVMRLVCDSYCRRHHTSVNGDADA